jgi:hypothetical protein
LDKLAFVPTSVTGPSGTGAGSAAVHCHALETNGRSWLPISTVGRSIPQNLGDSYQALMAVDMLDQYGARTDSGMVDFGLPPYLGGPVRRTGSTVGLHA